MTEEFHGPLLFPRYMPNPRRRQLAYLEQGILTLEDGTRFVTSSPEEIADLLYELNTLTFVPSIPKIQYFDWYIHNGRVWCTKQGTPTSIGLKFPRSSTRWLVSCQAWGYGEPSLDMLHNLRELYQLLEAGVANGPGGLGAAVMKQSWHRQFGDDWMRHRHERPNQYACDDISAHSTGSRSDLFEEHGPFDELVEIDMKNAFGWALAQPLPTGKCLGFWEAETAREFAIYWAECTVTIHDPLPYGIFPVRTEEQVLYPTRPGTYQCHLWSNTITRVEEAACSIEIKRGWGWYETTTDCAAFVKQMERFRDQAPAHLKPLIKQVLVAAIGRLGMSSTRHFLSEDGEEGVDEHLAIDGLMTDLFIITERDYHPQSMPHWMWYIFSLVREALEKEAMKWKKQELLVATNVDAVLLKPGQDMSAYPDKESSRPGVDSGELVISPSGTWQKRTLHRVTLPALRHLISDEKTVRPGIPRSGNRKP